MVSGKNSKKDQQTASVYFFCGYQKYAANYHSDTPDLVLKVLFDWLCVCVWTCTHIIACHLYVMYVLLGFLLFFCFSFLLHMV